MTEVWGGEEGFALREYVREHGVTSFSTLAGVDRRTVYQWLWRGAIPARKMGVVRGVLGFGGEDPRGRFMRLMIADYGAAEVALRLGVRLHAMWGWIGWDDYPRGLCRLMLRRFAVAEARGWPEARCEKFVAEYVK